MGGWRRGLPLQDTGKLCGDTVGPAADRVAVAEVALQSPEYQERGPLRSAQAFGVELAGKDLVANDPWSTDQRPFAADAAVRRLEGRRMPIWLDDNAAGSHVTIAGPGGTYGPAAPAVPAKTEGDDVAVASALLSGG